MNPILITRIADNKTFSEQSLAELLRDENAPCIRTDLPTGYYRPQLIYSTNRGWHVHFLQALALSIGDNFDLDPAKYKISFANTLDIERVREMIGDVNKALNKEWNLIRLSVQEQSPVDMIERLRKELDSIASKYL